jgi:hypothetical protein
MLDKTLRLRAQGDKEVGRLAVTRLDGGSRHSALSCQHSRGRLLVMLNGMKHLVLSAEVRE